MSAVWRKSQASPTGGTPSQRERFLAPGITSKVSERQTGVAGDEMYDMRPNAPAIFCSQTSSDWGISQWPMFWNRLLCTLE